MDDLQGFYGPNAGYVLELYERFLRDPESLDPQTRARFAHWAPLGDTAPSADGATPAAPVQTRSTMAEHEIERIIAISHLARSIRSPGHMAAQLDPLGSTPPGDPGLDPINNGISEQDLREVPAAVVDGP